MLNQIHKSYENYVVFVIKLFVIFVCNGLLDEHCETQIKHLNVYIFLKNCRTIL